MELISKGAEAYIYKDDDSVVKVRKSKAYRIPELDRRLIKRRTKRECNALKKCESFGINAPRVISCDENRIVMTLVEGVPLKDKLTPEWLIESGKLLGKLHSHDICHGDYAPTNLIISGDQLYVIDFGLVEFSTYYEKKAADLAVMNSSLKDEQLFSKFLEGYSSTYGDSQMVIDRYLRNLNRGRYKSRD